MCISEQNNTGSRDTKCNQHVLTGEFKGRFNKIDKRLQIVPE